jgi:acyl dehydratase
MDTLQIESLVATLRQRIGMTTAATITTVERGAIGKFALATGDDHPLYRDESYATRTRFGGIVAPPSFVAAFVRGHIPEIVVQDLPFARMLHSQDAVTNFRLMRPGDVITAYARYADAYSKAGARGASVYQAADLILLDAEQRPVSEVRIVTVSF